jgi:large subunit ribosomal protein L10
MLKRVEKEQIVADLKDKFSKSQAVFLTNLVGLTSNKAVDVRKKVRDAKGTMVVARNTLFALATKGTPLETAVSQIKGPHALAFAFEDAAAVAKCLKDASDDTEGLVSLKAASLDGKLLNTAELKTLASLPSRDQMLATLLATFNAPASAFVRVLHSIKEQKEKAIQA